MLSRNVLKALGRFETPFYLYDTRLLRETLGVLKESADKHGYRIHYAIKANYDPRILSIIKEYGVGIDCASGNELRCAVDAGFDPYTIVYAGVGKRDSELRYAIGKDIFSINCESLQELVVIDSIAGELGKVQRVALRINPDVDPKTHKCIDTGQADSKFGISYEEALSKIDFIKSFHNVKICGMHLHIGSQIRDLNVFASLCDKVNAISSRFTSLGMEFEFIDMGGGLGVDYESPESEPIPPFDRVFDIVGKHLDARGREVHFEYGRAIVAQCAELITKVMFRKDTATGRKLVIVDASMTELIRPALYGSYHDIENLSSAEADTEHYTIVGTACESTDVFSPDRVLPITKRGDLISIKTAGAYGMSMASRYNLHDLPAAVYDTDLID